MSTPLCRVSTPFLPLLALLGGCDGGGDVAPPPGDGAACGLVGAPDLDPDPGVVEVQLRAAPFAWNPGTGDPVSDGLAFEEQVPGPLIVVDRGRRLRVRLVNDTDLDTTMHWHGMRVPEDQDGIDQMSRPIRPGETFTYEFEARDAGLYWYHPHMDTDSVLERGLYGPLWVRDPVEPAVECLSVVTVDDLLVGGDGSVASASTGMGDMGMGGMDGMSMERLGDTLLANGRTGARTVVPPGASVLFAIVNAANARYFDLRLEGHELEVVGTDGGWLGEPHPVDSVRVAPGERWLIHTLAGDPGEYGFTTSVVDLHEGGDGGMADPLGSGQHTVWTLVVEGDEVTPTPLVLPTPEELPSSGSLAHTWVLDDADMGGMGGMGMAFTIDGETWPDVPLVTTASGLPVQFDVRNQSSMRHPFHLHGQRFAVLGSGADTLGWKDTFDVPAGETRSFVTLADNPGDWLYHCHILEHAEDGMAGVLEVRP